jgi:hypothetical protein
MKTGGVSLPPSPTPGRIFNGEWVPRRFIKFRVLWIVFIQTGVTKASGRRPGSVYRLRNNPYRQDSFRGYQQSQIKKKIPYSIRRRPYDPAETGIKQGICT